MKRLALTCSLLTTLVALPAWADPRLLPEDEVLLNDATRLERQILELHANGGGNGAIGLGVASLLTGLGSAAVGMVLSNGGEWQYFIPLVVLVPVLTTVLGTTLIIAGAISQGPPEEEVRALEQERDAVLARRAALLRARVLPETNSRCVEPVPSAPAPAASPAVPSPSAPPLVPGGHLRGPLVPVGAP
ncbi:MAG: hypothetical protein AB1938_15080 [Myxococcota bacterium]